MIQGELEQPPIVNPDPERFTRSVVFWLTPEQHHLMEGYLFSRYGLQPGQVAQGAEVAAAVLYVMELCREVR